MLCHLAHPAIAPVVGGHRVVPDGQCHVGHALRDGGLCRLQTAAADQLHPAHGGGPGVGDGVHGLLQIGHLLLRRPVPALPGRQRHTHGGGGEGAGGLGHHVRQRLRHLSVGAAGDEFHPAWIHPAIQYPHLAAIVPRHVFILHHKGKALVCSFHVCSPFLSHAVQPLGGGSGIV